MTLDKFLKCDECGAEWKANYGNSWWWQGKPYDTRECRDDAVARWKITHSTTEDDDAPDAEAVAHLEAAYEERTEEYTGT